MARYERDFHADASEPLTLNELVALLGNEGDARSRDDAIACYLSGDDGWREAVKRLDGAFAKGNAGLDDGKTD